MGSLFSKPKMPEPIIAPPPPTPPTSEDTGVKEAAAREAERIRKRKGMIADLKTSPLGLTIPPTVLKEKLGN